MTPPLAKKSGYGEWLTSLQKLSGSELNSFLLELFLNRVTRIAPTEILKEFGTNRFVEPSSVQTIEFKELELKWLKLAEKRDFIPVTLSPLTPFGTCSVVGKVNQNNVVSSVRGAEVVSDATNVFALLISQRYKKSKTKSLLKYATTHRHVRGQAFTNPAFSAHFGIFCLATGGVDTGSFSFEITSLLDHLSTHLLLLSGEFAHEDLSVTLYNKEPGKEFANKLKESLAAYMNSYRVEFKPGAETGKYYMTLQFKIFLRHKNENINLVDGGIVDWTQTLTSNRKHRLFISGSGIELVHKILKRKM